LAFVDLLDKRLQAGHANLIARLSRVAQAIFQVAVQVSDIGDRDGNRILLR
jgi:hypothetical protein